MKKVTKYVPGTPLTAEERRRLEQLAKLPDSEIDFSDIPRTTAADWKGAIRGGLYRPVKKALSLRLDADVLAWLKKDGRGYQTRANQVLREQMMKEVESNRGKRTAKAA